MGLVLGWAPNLYVTSRTERIPRLLKLVWEHRKVSAMDYYATALIEIFVNILFWLKSRFTKKPLVKGRPSVPSVPHH
jgi:hypothetical protein